MKRLAGSAASGAPQFGIGAHPPPGSPGLPVAPGGEGVGQALGLPVALRMRRGGHDRGQVVLWRSQGCMELVVGCHGIGWLGLSSGALGSGVGTVPT